MKKNAAVIIVVAGILSACASVAQQPPASQSPTAPAAPTVQTIADIYAGQDGLADKVVNVRGKVVKFSAMIMGKNWIHLQDGTGTPGSNDLTVTTADTAKIGDTILVSGKITLNKDFGGGYKYGVIMEDGKVQVEAKK